MIPILFGPSERSFTSNGICRLRDCISCTVTEELNSGLYECDFEYPVTGAHFDEIMHGNIIGVTHDEGGDIQAFDIVSSSRPINGIVSFHAVHVSYRLNYMTAYGSGVNTIEQAFDLFRTALPENSRFTYSTDMSATGYMAAADGIPHSVRQMIGGMEGSLLDTYGGEIEWDLFSVRLLRRRGEYRDLRIRYGVNLLNYKCDMDDEGRYRSCVPYWNGDGGPVIGNMVTMPNTDWAVIYRRCVPLDLTDKFEEKPSTSDLEAAALDYMYQNQTHMTGYSVDVDFLRLQDYSGFENLSELMSCKLGDWVLVDMASMYKTSSGQRIVKTVWDVLQDRYLSMTLGELATTLSEALGIDGQRNSTAGDTKSSITVFTPAIGSTITGQECYYGKYGGIATVNVAVTGLSAYSSNNIVTLPQGYRPRSRVMVPIQNGNLHIDTDGTVTVTPGGAGQVYGTTTFLIE